MHMHVVEHLSCLETSLESVDDEQVRLCCGDGLV